MLARVHISVLASLLLASAPALAIDTPEAAPEQSCTTSGCTVHYDAAFFSRYAPITALDMVRNLPGFSIDDGGGARGFGGAPPNVLVDSERVSSKSESPSDLLGRIPASQVERIDLIRGQAGGLDLRGQAVVANVIRREGATTSGAWNIAGRVRPPSDRARPRGSASVSTERGPVKLTIGGEYGVFQGIDDAREDVTGPDGELLEFRDEADRRDGDFHNVSMQARLRTDRTAWGLNLLADGFEVDGGETSLRTPEGAETSELFQGNVRERDGLEIGFDVERELTVDLAGKLIALYRRNDQDRRGSLVLDGADRSATRSQSLDEERILRMELDYAGLDGHLLELAVEGAFNSLDSDFALARADATGTLVAQPVPGASSKVEEERADVSLSDSLQRGPLSIDAVLAGEFSTLRQSGGFAEERSFAFFKPALTLTMTPRDELQLRMRALREIGQLNFFDFVSSADLGDDELALGNPGLEPEATNTLDATVEWRPGPVASVSVTAFHDQIEDVQDLLPLTGNLEVPGNIGDGTRSGVRTDMTLPLGTVGLRGGRLDLSSSWQTSDVDDPLTADSRRLSGEQAWSWDLSVRQDLTDLGIAWGASVDGQDGATDFGLDERDDSRRRTDIDAFVELRAIQGVLVRLRAENLLRGGTERDREVFGTSRAAGDLAFREQRLRRPAREFTLEVSGTF